jgi:Ca2+-binding EF-hand superfamily protein
MRNLTKTLALAAAVACTLVLPAAYAGDNMDAEKFITMCDKNKDGMISKAEMMKMMEQMFDKHDAKKTGKLDKKQVDAFLAELIKSGN